MAKKTISNKELMNIVSESLNRVLVEGRYDDDMEMMQSIREEIGRIAKSDPEAISEAINLFLNDLGDFSYFQRFGECLRFVRENSFSKMRRGVKY